MSCAAPLLALACIARFLQAQVPSAEPFQISVHVDLVVLNPVVTNSAGQFVSDLQLENFEVRENGVLQHVTLFRHEDVPVTVGLVIDHSGSMHRKLPDVILAARTFVKWSNPQDRMFIVNFNEKATFGLPAVTKFSNQATELEAAILSAPLTGQTAVYDALALGLERLRVAQAAKKVIILISDGGDNASLLRFPALLKQAAESNVLIYSIGIFDDDETDSNPDALRKLAANSGGSAYFPKMTSEVGALCESIARELRNQYTLGYVSSNPVIPGVFRTTKVAAHAQGKGKLSVRARSGYITAPAPQLGTTPLAPRQ